MNGIWTIRENQIPLNENLKNTICKQTTIKPSSYSGASHQLLLSQFLSETSLTYEVPINLM